MSMTRYSNRIGQGHGVGVGSQPGLILCKEEDSLGIEFPESTEMKAFKEMDSLREECGEPREGTRLF